MLLLGKLLGSKVDGGYKIGRGVRGRSLEKSWRWTGGGFRGRGQLERAGLYVGVGRVSSVECGSGRGPDVSQMEKNRTLA